MKPGKIRIRPWCTDDDISIVTELLHAAYKPLAEQGFKYWASYQDDQDTLDRLSKGDSFLMVEGNNVLGTISLVLPIRNTECEWLDRTDLVVFTQFAISPKYQGNGLGTKLLDYVEVETAPSYREARSGVRCRRSFSLE